MNQSKNMILSEIFGFIISAVLFTACWLVGYLAVQTNTALIIAAVVAVVVIVLIMIVNMALTRSFTRKFTSMRIKEAQDFMLGKKEDIEKDYAAAEAQVDKLIKNCFIVVAIMIAAFAVVSFLLGAAEPQFTDDEGGVSLAVLPLLCLAGQGAFAFLLKKSPLNTPKVENELTEKEFPLIVGNIKKCAQSIGIKKDVKVLFTTSGIGVTEFKNAIFIYLNPIEVAILTADELKSVMLHEFAHCLNNDTKKTASFEDFNAKTEGSISMIFQTLFVSYTIVQALFALTTYNTLSSREKEIRADKYVIEHGQAENYVNATAKAALYMLYSGYSWRETSYDVWEDETPISDFVHRDLNNFKAKLEIYRDRWFYTLRHELPQRVDSHPTFAMRMAACGLENFNAEKTETDENYVAEQDKFLSFADEIGKNNFDEKSYKETRNEVYVERNKLFEKAKNEDFNSDFASETAKIELAQAYMGVDNKKALELLNSVLGSSDSSLAYFLKGVILSEEYDDECIEMFTRAAQNSAFFDEAMDYLAKYALKTGKQDVIDNYRNTIADKKQASLDDDEATEIANITLRSPDKNDLVNNEVVEAVKEYWGDALSEVHLAECVTESGITAKYLAVTVKRIKDFDPMKAHKDTVDMLFRHSDNKTKFYLFYDGKGFKKIKNTPDSLMFTAKK